MELLQHIGYLCTGTLFSRVPGIAVMGTKPLEDLCDKSNIWFRGTEHVESFSFIEQEHKFSCPKKFVSLTLVLRKLMIFKFDLINYRDRYLMMDFEDAVFFQYDFGSAVSKSIFTDIILFVEKNYGFGSGIGGLSNISSQANDPMKLESIWVNLKGVNITLLVEERRLLLKLQTNIGHLKKYRQLLRSLNVRRGEGFTEIKKVKLGPKRSQRIRWEDGKSAFATRIRIDGVLCCEFIKENVDSEKQFNQFKYFNTKNAAIDLGTDLLQWYQSNIRDKIMNKLTEFQEGQSGLTLNRIGSLEININKYEFSNGGTSFIELPQEIKLQRAVINVKNTDQFCFAYAVLSCLYPVERNPQRIKPVPFIIYCDFEALLRSVDNSGNESKTERYQKHEAFAVGYFLHCNYDPSISYYRSYVGEDCVRWFIRELENIEKMVNSKLKSVIPMQYYDDANELNHIIRCHICGKSFNEDDKPIRGHCHFTGRFRGWAHSIWNLTYKKTFIVPVVFHNLTGYDSHLLIKDVAQCCPDVSGDYIHAQNKWKAFKLTNLKEYTQLYLKTDVLLLADVFENFRERCLNTYGLDPAHYYTLPGYTWNCMLEHTNVKLEFLQDVDMSLFFEEGIRGGVSQCCNRYAKANNKYMVNYDSNKPSNYLLYFDVNGLYAWAMSQYLPYGGFEFVDDFENFDILSVTDDSTFGYILEVDLNYPNNLHDLHRDLPLCPEHRTPPNSKLSKLMTTLYDKKREVSIDGSPKLYILFVIGLSGPTYPRRGKTNV
ncbi:hypothetical protein NQ317_004752 [Molorchus minor]|uniref:DNA-directed DNA polymerase n=1 Tax=Molorchus minor TaxID=1323400 RepID=A0ABQ9JGK0_9CUCU|nr:hypothetical protein NQ317_004752 [Molorchus minor]